MCLVTIWPPSRVLTWVWCEVILCYCLLLSLPASLIYVSPLCGPENNHHHGMWPGLGFGQVVKTNIIKSWDLVILGQTW